MGLVLLHLFNELGGTGLGDGADIGDHLLFVHANAIVANDDGFGLGVHFDLDLQQVIVVVQLLVGERLEAQFVTGIRGVRDEFSQKDLLVRVQGVDHQVKQLLDLGLEGVFFDFLFRRHKR